MPVHAFRRRRQAAPITTARAIARSSRACDARTVEVNEHTMARPSPALRSYVAYYSGYRQRGLPPARHRGLPSPYLTLILTLDEPLVIAAHPDHRQAPGQYDALLGGLHLSPAVITHDGRQSGVQVAVNPLGCRALFGLPAGELANIDTDLATVAGEAVVTELRERLRLAGSWPARFAAVDTVLCRLALCRLALSREAAVHPDVARAFRRLVAAGGDVQIAALADEVGWSARQLTNRFHAEVGLRPKEAARVVRFDLARRRLSPGVRLAQVAADADRFYPSRHDVA
jgi:AraC-like DNA-binding protein